ncbi:MAG TPA: type I DNA topoisomerase, partial [Thermosynechococcaceae cyanobacterium]
MAGKTLVLIEAPGKLRKLSQILSSDYIVKASGGHIRELASDGADSLGFDLVGDRVNCRWTPRDARAQATIADLKQAARAATRVILATDEDREGESIAWHLADVLGLKQPLRATYREITPAAVTRAIANPRPLDRSLVSAGICRAVLDKLVGYKGSPLVWQLNNGAKSIGRVQTAALHILCRREAQIRSFVPEDYWSVFVDYEGFRAFYKGSAAVTSEDSGQVDDATERGQTAQPESDRVRSQAEADRLVALARQHPHKVVQVEGKTVHRSPPPPFTTSSLQQAAGAKLRLSPEKTMQIAQSLYEQGHITYHRTDSVFLAENFQAEARQWLRDHDPTNLPAKSTQHRSSKTAQEAHEAIRPTHIARSSASLKPELTAEAFELYVLIWKRTIAALCCPARLQQSTILTRSGEVTWVAKGQVVEFAGYTRYWNNLSGDTQLPVVQPGQALTLLNAGNEKKQTQPPPRYTEPKLVQQMERSGIGRPSTYAPTVATLKQRQYVEVVKNNLQPTALGMEVDSFVVKALPKLVDAAFTADMEDQLDLIAAGKLDWQQWLTGWNRDYLVPALQQAQQIIPTVAHAATGKTGRFPFREVAPTLAVSNVPCPQCQQPMVQIPTQKVKKGYFLKCESCADTVLFWNDLSKQWEPPKPKTEAAIVKLTEHPCPVCKKPLEAYRYQKEGSEKVMLRCSDSAARQKPKHKEAVY